MIKLQIGENTICLNKAEQDFLFQLIDEKYDYVQNIPTFNAIRNWMYEEGCRPSVVKVENKNSLPKASSFSELSKLSREFSDEKKDKVVEDPWDKTVIEDPWMYEKLKFEEKGKCVTCNSKVHEKELEEYFERKQPQDEVQYKNLREILMKLLSNNESGYYIAC